VIYQGKIKLDERQPDKNAVSWYYAPHEARNKFNPLNAHKTKELIRAKKRLERTHGKESV
jgi:hypothetical protein